MLIVLDNNDIIGVDKRLLNELNADLQNISEIIKTVSVQIASLTDETLNINNKNFKVTEKEILSLKNIKVYDLTKTENETALEIKKEETFNEPLIKEPVIQTPTIEEPVLESSPEIEEHEPKIDISDLLKEENTQEPEIKLDTEIKIFPTQEEVKKETPVEEIKLNLEEHLKEEPEIKKESEIKEETPKIEESIKTVMEEIKPLSEETKEGIQLTTEEKEIEISFEDDLEEIREILELSTEEFNKEIHQELQKAGEELGIEIKDLEEWYEQLIDQILDEKPVIYKNIDKRNYEALHKSYHKLKGAALNLRLSKIALILKKLDELSKNKETMEKIKTITDDFYSLIENKQIKKQKNTSGVEITDIVLNTIKSYLQTQNEEQFQKDKKYIEKLLNTKIESLKDLENIIKGIK